MRDFLLYISVVLFAFVLKPSVNTCIAVVDNVAGFSQESIVTDNFTTEIIDLFANQIEEDEDIDQPSHISLKQKKNHHKYLNSIIPLKNTMDSVKELIVFITDSSPPEI